MTEILFENRRCVRLENDVVRVTVSVEGGHVAEILEKTSGVNPLWIPPWPSIEPSQYSLATHPEYGNDKESKLLAGILGHNVCIDMFGPPSDAEYAAGLYTHGEANVVEYHVTQSGESLTMRCELAHSQLGFERTLTLDGQNVRFRETVQNHSALDRPIGWTQHVTLGPPFLERGSTQFRMPGTRSASIHDPAEFQWPLRPLPDGTHEDMQIYTSAQSSGGITTHRMDPKSDQAYFLAFSPRSKVLLGYVWKTKDYPWMAIWEENHSREHAPWNRRSLTRGMEFGVSPFPETRLEMIERKELFDTPGYRWIPGKAAVTVDYFAFVRQAETIPDRPDHLY